MKYKDPNYMRKYRDKHADAIKQYQREYYAKTRDRQKQASVLWQQRNPERFKLFCKVTSANRRYPGKLTVKDIEFVIERYGRKCYWCAKDNLKDRDFTLEHLEPRNHRDVLVIACLPCNASKCARMKRPRKTKDEIRAERKIYHGKWRAANAEYILVKSREYQEMHKDKLKEYNRQYRLKRKAEAAARGEKYRG